MSSLILSLSLQKIDSVSCIFHFPLCLLTVELCHYSLLAHTHTPFSLSHTFMLAHTLKLTHTYTHTCAHTHIHSYAHAHISSYTHTYSLPLTLTSIHSHSLSLSVYLLSFSDIIPYYPMSSPTFSTTPPLQTFFPS